jgi:4'-phosphopantetheinyl transferase
MILTVDPLGPDDVDVWFLRVPDAVASPVAGDDLMLSTEERVRAAAFYRAEDRLRFETGRIVLRRLLGGYLSSDPRTLRIDAATGQKPRIAEPAGAAPIEFNLTHTPGLLAWVFAIGRPVGVDAEQIDRMRSFDTLPAGYFSQAEAGRLAGTHGRERHRRLSEHWTLKEAFAKAIGSGLTVDVSRFSFDIQPDLSCRCDDTGAVDVTSWEFRLLRPTADHTAAVCAAARPGAPQRFRIHEIVPKASERNP